MADNPKPPRWFDIRPNSLIDSGSEKKLNVRLNIAVSIMILVTTVGGAGGYFFSQMTIVQSNLKTLQQVVNNQDSAVKEMKDMRKEMADIRKDIKNLQESLNRLENRLNKRNE